jgi:hypothetical protein
MGKAVPEQHPAVVLRSHYVHLRALLVAALIAVLGLTAAVVIVANDSDKFVKSTPAPAIEYGGPNEGSADITPGVNLPARPNQAQAFPGQAQQAEAGASRNDIRMDLRRLRAGGVTSEGSVGVTMSPPIGASSVLSQTGPRYDGGPNEGSADTHFRGSKASVMPQTASPRYDGGPNEGSADVTTGHFPCSTLVAPQSDGSPCGGN